MRRVGLALSDLARWLAVWALFALAIAAGLHLGR